jgi:hypothetical protein
VAELVGYLSFVPIASGGEGAVAGVHPERVVPGAHPERGLVLSGKLRALHPAGACWEAGLAAGPETVWCRLPEAPGAEVTVTVLDPPCFGPDGTLLPRSSAQVRA